MRCVCVCVCVHTKLKIVLSRSEKNCVGILLRIALKLINLTELEIFPPSDIFFHFFLQCLRVFSVYSSLVYRRATVSGESILHLIPLLKIFIVHRSLPLFRGTHMYYYMIV